MTLMADFLLQPTAGKDGGRAASRETDPVASQARQRDFSRMLHQQRQAADVRPPAAPPADRPQTDTGQAAHNTQGRGEITELRQKDDSGPAKNDQTVTTATEDGAVVPDQTLGRADKLTADAHSETPQDEGQDAEDNSPPASLDPLLAQILMAHGQNEADVKPPPAEGETRAGQTLISTTDLPDNLPGSQELVQAEHADSGEDAEPHMRPAEGSVPTVSRPTPPATAATVMPSTGTQAMVTAGPLEQPAGPQPTVQLAAMQREAGQPAAASSTSFMQSAQTTGQRVADSAPESMESAADSLLADLGEEGEALARLVNAGGLLDKEARPQGDTRAGQSQIDRLDGAGMTRSDTLLRSEAVQSAQGARQLAGQPLNMQQPGWDKELVDKVMWMSSKNLKSAEIKLNPLELGRLDIRVQIGQEHTQITFNSAHAGVRDSLDAQMHRLREMLEQQGMHNVDVDVADQSQQHERYAGATGDSRAARTAADEGGEELHGVSGIEQQESGHAGLVSYYV
ncbi:MAG: hypothetical protein GX665_02480 [Gammaproteobacteria bacterium]|nr:hypothetical protein [Gammaproteobacteria bacterium]